MKLKIFRIISLIVFILLGLLGLYLAISNLILVNNGSRDEPSYFILFIGLLLGVFFVFFEAFFVIKSFKEGTLMLHELCMYQKSLRKRKATLIVALVILSLGVFGITFNLLSLLNVLNVNLTPMSADFNIFYFALILVNGLIVSMYWLFIAEEDIELTN